jgi:hypothetical protein
VILLSLFSQSKPAHAQSIVPASSNLVEVGVYVLNIGALDLATGQYTVDFYLSMRCANLSCNLGKFEFMNGRATSIQLQENSTTEKFWRIEANLYNNLDFRDYPFDSHALTIRIEDTSLTKSNLTYESDQKNSGLDPSIVVVGWNIEGWAQSVVDHYYQAYNETYSQYVFTVTLDRGYFSAIEMFLPVFFLTFIALIAMLMYGQTSSVLENRILLTASTLIASVLFQFTLDSSVPPLGYLTFADRFMLATYCIIVSALVIGIIVLDCLHKKNESRSARIQHYSIRIMPLAAIAVYALLFLLFV